MNDINRLCPGCMRELKHQFEKHGQCPHCGYCPDTYKQNPRCLPVHTILAGKYLVGTVLGQGGFGITYIGYDLNMETRVAIKEYFPVELVSRDTTAMTGDRVLSLSGEKSVTYQQGLKKYVAEAQSVSRFSDVPGVVSVKDFFYENETAYIVMEYIEGQSLKDYLKEQGGKLSEEETLRIMKPVLEALVKVHAAGIIHRDISPDNIMLTFEDENRTHNGGSTASSRQIKDVKLIDFGAARMTAKNDQKSLTIILKHGYAPEEQYRTHGEQGSWTDVYAICAVMYRMLTGVTPVPAMDRLFKDDLKSFEELGIKVSPNTADAILKGLAVKKDDRIQSMQELIAVLYEGKKVKQAKTTGIWNVKTISAMAAVIIVVMVVVGIFFPKSDADNGNLAESSNETVSGEMPDEVPAEENLSSDEMLETAVNEEKFGEVVVTATPQTSISVIQSCHTLIRMPDGSVTALGGNEYGQCMVEDWDHIAAVSAGYYHSLGLRSDGKVLAAGRNDWGQCEVENWSDIIAVAAGRTRSFGLKKDGTVVFSGNNLSNFFDEIKDWNNITAITAYDDCLIGLDQSGTVHFAGFDEEMHDISGWNGVKYLAYGWMYGDNLIGIKEDGTVLRSEISLIYPVNGVNRNFDGIENWTDIQQICVNTPVLGVKKDGTVAFLETSDSDMQEKLAAWTDMESIVSVYTWDSIYLIGLQKDGTILTYRDNRGNAVPEEMSNLAWVQIIGSMDENLLAMTTDGRPLSYGLNFRMDDSAYGGLEHRYGDFKNIQRIVGYGATLQKDGTVFSNSYANLLNKEFRIGKDVTQALELQASPYHLYYALLTKDGHVEIEKVCGETEDISDIDTVTWQQQAEEAESWKDIIQIEGENGNLYGLHADGTVSTTRALVEEQKEKIKEAENICKIAVRNGDVLGLKTDGTVVPIHSGEYAVKLGKTQVNNWEDIQDIAMGESHVVGLKKDGTVVAAGSNHAGQCKVDDWKDIVSIVAGKTFTLGITKDGNLKMAGIFY